MKASLPDITVGKEMGSPRLRKRDIMSAIIIAMARDTRKEAMVARRFAKGRKIGSVAKLMPTPEPMAARIPKNKLLPVLSSTNQHMYMLMTTMLG